LFKSQRDDSANHKAFVFKIKCAKLFHREKKLKDQFTIYFQNVSDK
jgi:hypothetical protein